MPVADRLWVLLRQWVLGKRTLKFLLCDFVEHVLPTYEEAFPGDTRVRDCIETTRRYLRDDATLEELKRAKTAAYRAIIAAHGAAEKAAVYAAEAAVYAAEDNAHVACFATACAHAACFAAACTHTDTTTTGRQLCLQWQLQKICESVIRAYARV